MAKPWKSHPTNQLAAHRIIFHVMNRNNVPCYFYQYQCFWIQCNNRAAPKNIRFRENSSALWKTFSTGKYFPAIFVENFFHCFCRKIFSTIFRSLERRCELLKFGHISLMILPQHRSSVIFDLFRIQYQRSADF